MAKVIKLILLFLTLWPIPYVAIFILSGSVDFYASKMSVVVHLVSLAVILGISIFYFVELYHNHLMNQKSRMKWLLLFLITGPVGMALYWKRYIW